VGVFVSCVFYLWFLSCACNVSVFGARVECVCVVCLCV